MLRDGRATVRRRKRQVATEAGIRYFVEVFWEQGVNGWRNPAAGNGWKRIEGVIMGKWRMARFVSRALSVKSEDPTALLTHSRRFDKYCAVLNDMNRNSTIRGDADE